MCDRVIIGEEKVCNISTERLEENRHRIKEIPVCLSVRPSGKRNSSFWRGQPQTKLSPPPWTRPPPCHGDAHRLPSKGSKRRNLSDTSMEMEEESVCWCSMTKCTQNKMCLILVSISLNDSKIQDEQQQQRHITILKGDWSGEKKRAPTQQSPEKCRSHMMLTLLHESKRAQQTPEERVSW